MHRATHYGQNDGMSINAGGQAPAAAANQRMRMRAQTTGPARGSVGPLCQTREGQLQAAARTRAGPIPAACQVAAAAARRSSFGCRRSQLTVSPCACACAGSCMFGTLSNPDIVALSDTDPEYVSALAWRCHAHVCLVVAPCARAKLAPIMAWRAAAPGWTLARVLWGLPFCVWFISWPCVRGRLNTLTEAARPPPLVQSGSCGRCYEVMCHDDTITDGCAAVWPEGGGARPKPAGCMCPPFAHCLLCTTAMHGALAPAGSHPPEITPTHPPTPRARATWQLRPEHRPPRCLQGWQRRRARHRHLPLQLPLELLLQQGAPPPAQPLPDPQSVHQPALAERAANVCVCVCACVPVCLCLCPAHVHVPGLNVFRCMQPLRPTLPSRPQRWCCGDRRHMDMSWTAFGKVRPAPV